jgi:bacteriocin-like protein
MKKVEQNEKKTKPAASPDSLVRAGKKGGAELTEDELKKVAGGYKEQKAT